MFLGQEFKIFDWFIIHFTENNGMAFGLEFGGDTGKIILSLFRIVVVLWGIYYVNELSKRALPNGVLVSLGLVIGGAIGNIIDGVFYGVLFNDSYNQIAKMKSSHQPKFNSSCRRYCFDSGRCPDCIVVQLL